MPLYKFEAEAAYRGLRECNTPPSQDFVGAILTESLPPGIPLPYRTREIRERTAKYRGFVADATITLTQDGVVIRPELDEHLLERYIAQELSRNPAFAKTNPEDYEKVAISLGRIERQDGLKLYLLNADDMWPVRLYL